MTMTYGKTTPTYYTDPEVIEVNKCTTRLGKVIPAGQHIVDRYPLLRHIPFVVSTLRHWHKEELSLFSKMVEEVRVQVVSWHTLPAYSNLTIHRGKAEPSRRSRLTCWNINRNMTYPMMNWLTSQDPCSEQGLTQCVFPSLNDILELT